MSVFDDDVVTRAQVVRDRLATLRAHQAEQRQQLHAIVIQDLLDAGCSLSEAGSTLGLSRTFVHREAQRATEPARRPPEFEAIDAEIERYLFG